MWIVDLLSAADVRIAIASYLGTSTAFEEALGSFAEEYADQNDRDYAAFKAAWVSAATKSKRRSGTGG